MSDKLKCIAKRKGFFGGNLVKAGKVFYPDVCPDWAVECESNDKGEITTLSIRDVLLTLRRDDDSAWTKTGTPNLKFVTDIAGYKVSKDEVQEAWPGFHRDMMKHGEKQSDGTIIGA